jgi:predicted Fe-Mo cluster-binding NifX family protein
MKIAIPVDEKTLESNVCASFGRTPYFLIYDTETKERLLTTFSAERDCTRVCSNSSGTR